MRVIQVADRAKQALDRLAARLRKDFPENDGEFAVLFVSDTEPHVDLGSTRYGWPQEDTRPDFVKADDVGWERIK